MSDEQRDIHTASPTPTEREQFNDQTEQIFSLIENENIAEAAERVEALDSEDQAELLNRMSDSMRNEIVPAISANFDHEILPHLDPDTTDDVLHSLGVEKSAEVISELDTEDAVQVMSELDEPEQQEILENLDAETRHEMEEGLAYPEESAGRLMRKKFVAVPDFWTVGDTIDHMRSHPHLPEDFYVIFAVSPHYHPTGEVLLAKIMGHSREMKISDIMKPRVHSQQVDTDQEEVAYDFRKYALVEAPVTDQTGRLIGTITVDDIVDVIQEETEEDFLHAGGVSEQDIQDSLMTAVSKRFPWLFINLLTAIVASFIIDFYQDTIQQLVLLAVLMPIVASMGGNAGIQACTIAVRAIATRRLPTGRGRALMQREMTLGAINGVGIAIVTAFGVYFFYHDITVAAIFACATILTMMVAGFSGAALPMLLLKFGIDPAISSGVFLTMITDMVGFFTFLGLATLILN